MDLVLLYKSLSDPTRLRIVNILRHGPQPVWKLQKVLEEPQVKMSKHLGYMKKRGILTSQRKMNCNLYHIATNAHPVLEANLQALERYACQHPVLASDLKNLDSLNTTAAGQILQHAAFTA